MTLDECISVLESDIDLILFDPDTGKTYEPDELKYINELNYKTYIANKTAIAAIKELQAYKQIGSINDLYNLSYSLSLINENINKLNNIISQYNNNNNTNISNNIENIMNYMNNINYENNVDNINMDDLKENKEE